MEASIRSFVETKLASNLRESTKSAKLLLKEFGEVFDEMRDDVRAETMLQCCALATQFLCLAFLSYTQAHIGPIETFFLEKPQETIMLEGFSDQSFTTGIKAELVELSCLAGMTNKPVLAFSCFSQHYLSCKDYDILTNVEDFLDTWGPGCLIHDPINQDIIYAIAVGNGYVHRNDSTSSTFHWSEVEFKEEYRRHPFDFGTQMRIGSIVRINTNCCMDEASCRQNSSVLLEPLGTQKVSWVTHERQIGFSGGQYVGVTATQTYAKIPGITLKQLNLQQKENWRLIPFLEQSWGLQISICTSVARRVPLRELVADLLPMFANPLREDMWETLITKFDIVDALKTGNLFQWFNQLNEDLQSYVFALIRAILDQLKHTGLDPETSSLVIAWPWEHDVGRALKIPYNKEICWAKFIADSENCATFAYVTPKCLETSHIKCSRNVQWQNTSKLLMTAVSPNQPVGETVVSPTGQSLGQDFAGWTLQDQKVYYVRKLDSLLCVRVQRPRTMDDVAHLILSNILTQGKISMKRLLETHQSKRQRQWIRERQSVKDFAELVIVRADQTVV